MTEQVVQGFVSCREDSGFYRGAGPDSGSQARDYCREYRLLRARTGARVLGTKVEVTLVQAMMGAGPGGDLKRWKWLGLWIIWRQREQEKARRTLGLLA